MSVMRMSQTIDSQQSDESLSNWSFKSGTNLPIISVESNMNEALCAAVMHGEGVAIAIDRWWLDENNFPNISYNSLEDRRWKFTEDLFVEEERQLRGSRTFTFFMQIY